MGARGSSGCSAGGVRGPSVAGSSQWGGGAVLSAGPRSVSPAEEWVRPVMKRDKQVLLHWGYYPDR